MRPATHRFISARRQQWHHRLYSALLMVGIFTLLGALAWSVFGPFGWVIAFAGSIYGRVVSQRVVVPRVLRAQRAVPIHPAPGNSLNRIMQHLASRSGLTTVPRLYVAPHTTPNAYAAGTATRFPSVVVTQGLLRSMPVRELISILAHEVAHLKHGDTLLMATASMARWLTRGVALLGLIVLGVHLPSALAGQSTLAWSFVGVVVVGPTLALLLQLALSRTREFNADLTAVQLTRDPTGFARALIRVDQMQSQLQRRWLDALPRWLRSHPKTSDRIQRIVEAQGPIGVL